ncbi:hypothetical protein TYRP_021585 [Tyrophagus putrescentiae]|nr:hypothetical protein TYRP_021585 [Tyrophagus putrescentiae]
MTAASSPVIHDHSASVTIANSTNYTPAFIIIISHHCLPTKSTTTIDLAGDISSLYHHRFYVNYIYSMAIIEVELYIENINNNNNNSTPAAGSNRVYRLQLQHCYHHHHHHICLPTIRLVFC